MQCTLLPLQFWTEEHPVTTRKLPESKATSSSAVSAAADDWMRLFTKHFELNFLAVSGKPSGDPSLSELRLATARAVYKTFLDSGMEFEAVVELLGQAAFEGASGPLVWDDTLNQRRFALIDKDIQGSLTPEERLELAGLTRMMRDHVDSEANLPTRGARALHRKLLHLGSSGEGD